MTDVMIIGSGIMGAVVARHLREVRPSARIVMVDGAPEVGGPVGQHLHDIDDATVRAAYAQKVSSGIQGLYVGTGPTPSLGTTADGAAPGMYSVASFGHDTSQMPGAAFAWNRSGMGVHWTAATPTPWGVEIFDRSDGDGPAGDDRWQRQLQVAQSALRVHPGPFSHRGSDRWLLSELDAEFGPQSGSGRHPQVMPMAAQPVAGIVGRTGPDRIFPRMLEADGPDFTLRAGLATKLIFDGARVPGAELTDLATGERQSVLAGATVVCADPIRTPQLLFASGIRPAALGRWFAEHAFITGRVFVAPARFGMTLAELPSPLTDEWLIGSYWLPHSDDAQPFHGQIMSSVPRDEDGTALAFQVGLSWYVPTSLRPDNRLEFSDTDTDATGMPKLTIHFSYDDGDLAAIEQARSSQAGAGRRLGDFDPVTDSALLPAGSSLHFTGSSRMGAADDGTSVCDRDGRVWGVRGLFLAGGAVVPTPAVGNSTLLAAVTAVRAAEAVAAELDR